MASLRNIMNVEVDDEHEDFRSRKTSASGPVPNSGSSMVPGAHRRGLESSLDTSSSRAQGTDPSSSHLSSSSHFLPINQSTSAVANSHLLTPSPSDRRQSIASIDSMDSHHEPRHNRRHNHGRGPDPHALRHGEEIPVKLTPITRRVSRAKKGVPVHTCDMCRPPKTFTRAEHLRRHQLSHQPPDLSCPVPGCDKTFHRHDLLARHQQKHGLDARLQIPNGAGQASSLYRSGERRESSVSRSSPPVSSTPFQQLYGNASQTSTSSSIPMGSGHWATHRSMPVHLHQGHTDDTLEGMRNEYMLDSVSNLHPSAASIASNFTQPRSMPAIPEFDFVHDIGASLAAAPALAWPAASSLTTATPQTTFSLPTTIDTTSRRPDLSVPSAGWLSSGDAAPRGVSSSITATSGGFSGPYTYGTSLSPPSHLPMYSEEPCVGYTGYGTSPTLYDAYISTPELRASPLEYVSNQSSDTMVTAPAPLSVDRVAPNKADTSSGYDVLSRDIWSAPLNREAESALPTYVDIYWDKMHPLYPIIHRATIEDGTNESPEQLHALRCAMGAVATQNLIHRDHRINGSQLHAFALQSTKPFTSSARWSLPTMQCILLCEYYARFRGRHKEDYKPSSQFRTVYQMIGQMVSDHCFTSRPNCKGTKQQRWKAWIHVESCRRLLSACFLLSVHGMFYHEQPYSDAFSPDNMMTSEFYIPLSGSTTSLWDAPSAETWASIDMSTIQLKTVGDVMHDARSSHMDNPAFDVSLIIAAHALRLPRRQHRRDVQTVHDVSSFRCNDLLMFRYFGNRPGATTYLALYYTPLHILLAVSGESWVFRTKLPDIHTFSEHKRKLSQWRDSGTCAIATVFAARAIRDFLGLSPDNVNAPPMMNTPKVKGKDISDYWGLYICTLICWAFGHRAIRPCTEEELPTRTQAVRWIQAVAEMEPYQLQGSVGREHSQAIVGLVRGVLEKDCLVGRNVLLADSVSVLRRIEDRSRVWFQPRGEGAGKRKWGGG
ncbi:hypothetical protein E4U27_007234 [Claviceps purpurea]|nr:hypothetical protein E4U27_007234 [Claviceps purpurea]